MSANIEKSSTGDNPIAPTLQKDANTFGFLIKNVVESFGIKLAPWNVPMERRLQTLAAAAWIILMMFGEIASLILIVYIIRTNYYWIGVLYVIMIAYQRNTCGLGNNSWKWVRRWKWWQYLKDYFPIKLEKTVELDPKENYLFCIFPHGVLSTGCFSCFATDANGFDELFPGMKSYMLTLDGHFMVPFFRELARWLRVCSASAESMNYLLDRKNGTGKCAVLVVGGAAEALNCHSGLYKVILNRRRGFIRMAMKHGVPLVPVFSYGETELYEQMNNPEGSTVRNLQEWFRRSTGIAPLLPLGRGLLQYTFGIVPQRKSITTVVGKPLEIKQNINPTNEELDEVHAVFIKRLEEMFEEGKAKYLPDNPDAKLIIS